MPGSQWLAVPFVPWPKERISDGPEATLGSPTASQDGIAPRLGPLPPQPLQANTRVSFSLVHVGRDSPCHGRTAPPHHGAWDWR